MGMTSWKFDWADKSKFNLNRESMNKDVSKFVKKWSNNNFTNNSELLKLSLIDYESIWKNHGYGGEEGYYYWLLNQLNLNGGFIIGWFILLEFIFTLALALKCYPLQPGGLLLIQAIIIDLTNPYSLLHEIENNLEVTVDFVSELITCVKDKDKKIISGDPEKVKKVYDTWKFSRDLRTTNPNWLLVDTIT